MTQKAHLDPDTATTADLRSAIARSRLRVSHIADHTRYSRSALSILINQDEAVNPDLNREVLAAIDNINSAGASK